MKELASISYSSSVVMWSYPTKSVKADVLFGTPGRDCSGVGICRVGYRGTLNVETNTCKAAMAEISLTKSRQLALKFNRQDLCQRIQKKYFRHGYFRVKKDFWMPNFINKALWLQSSYRIKPGRYTVEITPLHFIVKF